MALRRARSVDEYVDWVRQAVFEVADLRDCLEYELEDLGKPPAFLEPLAAGIRGLMQSMQDGVYSFGREDLPFMDLARRYSDSIPFHTLLTQINETHRRGLDVEAEDAYRSPLRSPSPGR
jgi:hypothetical protein